MPTPRHHQLRKVAVSLAAVTAVLGLAACDIGVGTPTAAAPTSAPTSVAAVPVGSVEELEPTPDSEAPADEAPAEEEAPGAEAPDEEAPAEEETPAVGAPAEGDGAEGEAPVDGAPGEEAPAEGEEAPADGAPVEEAPESEAPVAAPPAPPAAGGLETLGGDCTGSELEAHDGFQNAPRCVSIAMGEVPAQDKSPAILIVDSPVEVDAGETFEIVVSSCNLVRDRFLGAGAGGYYRESSFLDADGFVRGHFHTAVQAVGAATEAPDSAPAPAFFLATQDNGGGAGCDDVRIPITVAEPGSYRISTWAGDGSHRTPMMQRANQTPAFDTVRLTVN